MGENLFLKSLVNYIISPKPSLLVPRPRGLRGAGGFGQKNAEKNFINLSLVSLLKEKPFVDLYLK